MVISDNPGLNLLGDRPGRRVRAMGGFPAVKRVIARGEADYYHRKLNFSPVRLNGRTFRCLFHLFNFRHDNRRFLMDL